MRFGGQQQSALAAGHQTSARTDSDLVATMNPTSSSSSSSSASQSNNNNNPSTMEPPHVQPPADKVSFHLKSSIFTRRVTLDRDKMALGMIKQLAIAFLNELYFQHQLPQSSFIGDYIRRHYSSNDNLSHLYERLQLSLYQPSDQNAFVPFNLVSDIEPESYVIIEVSERADHLLGSTSSGQLAASQTLQCRILHDFRPETFLRPTYCAACSSIIKGLIRQGLQCQQCRRNYCPKCKLQVESLGEPCFFAHLQQQQQQQQQQVEPQQATSVEQASGNAATKGELSQLASNGAVGKRKSPSNLLHFNLANPFKSHHAPQASGPAPVGSPPQPAAKTRGSAGALDPVLQQLSRLRDQPTGAGLAKLEESSLAVAQQSHLSSSHQNLFNGQQQQQQVERPTLEGAEGPPGSSSSLQQSPEAAGSPRPSGQLSSSARTSKADLQLAAHSPSKSSGHAFLSMDWIQVGEQLQCEACKKPLRSSAGGGAAWAQQPAFMCKVCKIQVHAHCQTLVLVDCMNRLVEASRAAAAVVAAAAAADEQPTDEQQPAEGNQVRSTNSNVSRENIPLHRLAPSVRQVKRPEAAGTPIIEGWLRHTTLADEWARRHYWRLHETDLTLYESDTSKRYFKAIALNKITRVMSASSLPKQVREDVLMGGLRLQAGGCEQPPAAGNRSAGTSPVRSAELQAQMRAMFAFELATGSMYLVQADSEAEASRWRDSLASCLQAQRPTSPVPAVAPAEAEPKSTGGGRELATVNKLVESIGQVGAELVGADEQPASSPKPQRNVMVAQQRQPPAQRPTQQQHQQQQRHQHHYQGQTGASRQAHQADPTRSRLYNRPRITIRLKPLKIPDHLVVGKHLIEPDRHTGEGFEVLGSGQFGKVYAAITELKSEDSSNSLWSGVPVAIKEISKSRFDLRQQAKLKNEANILSRLDHPGVIILERVHDLADKIYIVMEQLEDDMLEMIVSTEEKRLNERVTKFLTYQILEALKYLHAQNIAHCDLKPENVLLVERGSQYPQIKLCDFGFAKIIEDNSFRSSLVGTPAYLAPEVVKGERYNRSVDLWSVGVIVYVSLSGEFPFNEGENIHDQISRANFMYPDQPWAKISQQAKDFITSLLRVNCEKRLSANRAQMDDWIQDYQLWCDLSELEVRVGKRWVTDDADYKRWSRYAREKQLVIPRAAEQLHEELKAE